MRYVLAVLALFVSIAFCGCGESDPEHPPEAVPQVPPGRTMPGAEGGGGAPMPAPPK